MSKRTKQDIIELVEEEDVEFIRLQFVDIYGNLKNMAVTTSQLHQLLDYKCTFDCGAIEGFNGVERQELVLHPDLDTFEIFPWRPQTGKVARFICDVYTIDGKPFDCDSRNVLKRVIKRAQEMGYSFDVGPECEFFLFDCDETGNATNHTNEQGGYFDMGPLDTGENARREMILTLEEMGFTVLSSFHADAPGQHEIDFKYNDALTAADNLITFKLVVRTVARRHGVHATFMPKPKTGVKGSGMRINIALRKDGKDIFKAPNGEGISDTAKMFIAGLMKHASGMSLVTNPIVNSYKRLVPGYEAPICIGWSYQNPIPLIRIPGINPDGVRIELRSPDAASNPYLALAVCLAAGLDGIKDGKMPPESMDYDMSKMTIEDIRDKGIKILPATLGEAIAEFEKSDFIKEVVGPHITKTYLEAKKQEWKKYCLQVTPWEVEQYLNRI
ncbi:glutamine synthetase type I [Lachnospiraceae bacterium KM106-2]|nr:glutamine synthetase type I [Lachnospiraceae bacterium KM106-2]